MSRAPGRYYNNPDHWQQRAKETRALADETRDEVTRRIMHDLARDYGRLAVRALIRTTDKE